MVLAAMGMLAGCRAAPAPDAGFIEQPELMQKSDDLPFDAYWSAPDVNLASYTKVYIAPVNTDHLLSQEWWDKVNVSFDIKESADKLAKLFQKDMVEGFTDYDGKKYQVVDVPDDQTLMVELALVEVVPAKVWLNLVTEIFIGGLDEGTTAFEGRLRDGKTKKVIAEFKDREYGQMSIISVADLQWYAHSRHTLSRWSDFLPEVINRKPGERISKMATVTLRPW
jgi:hypothetical protein